MASDVYQSTINFFFPSKLLMQTWNGRKKGVQDKIIYKHVKISKFAYKKLANNNNRKNACALH